VLCCPGVNAQVTDSAIPDTSAVSLAKPRKGKFMLKGIVKDKASGEIVPYTTVFFPGSSVGTISDEEGVFILVADKKPGDTLRARLMGYGEAKMKVDWKSTDTVIVFLEPSGNMMKEIIIRAGEDPAVTLIKKVIDHKKFNNPDKLDNYGYEAYNKIELDAVNLTREQFRKLPIPFIKKMSFIYDNLDTVSGKQPFLPFFLIESLSDYYYQKDPSKKKEIIKANLIRGIENESITQYTGMMYLGINPYSNFIPVFDKQSPSPLSNLALSYYKYKIKDTIKKDGYNIIELSFKPLRAGTICLSGTIRIVDSVFALSYINAEIPKDANINWVKDASFFKEYELLNDSLWFCTKDNITAEFTVGFMKLPGLIARKTTSYRNIKINDTSVSRMVNDPDLKDEVIILDSARDKSNEYWAAVRHDSLTKNESGIYKMFDSMENNPTFLKFKHTVRFLATGTYKLGIVEFGPYWSLYTNSRVEGHRFRFSMGTTPELFKSAYFYGYLAYGTRDERFKYFLSGLWIINRHPRMYLAASYKSDNDYTVQYYEKAHLDNIFSLAIRKPGVPMKLFFTKETLFEYHTDYSSGFSHRISFKHKDYHPYQPLPSFSIYRDERGNATDVITDASIDIRLRYAHREKFLEGSYYRVSLGSKYPVPEFHYERGIKGAFGSLFQYDKFTLSVSDDWRIAPLGKLYLNVFAGKYYGTLPYNLLANAPGNENLFYNKYAFNLMNQYEYLSDQYAGINLEHSIGGGIFSYIPLVKKLRLRQFWTAKGIVGSLNDENRKLNMNKGFGFRTFDGKPYVEVGTGVENILHLFRIDFVWRLKPEPAKAFEPRSKYFGIFGSLKLDF
jgi:hypothetical protein